ncbi:MAG: hypothetical protein HOE11_00835 [Candidatus Diapherotrites archaeon]|nr:hypothetical protein [Candidatus Diapherotrites archaeon]MBT4596769.1 hypothetical protein [Candidatus Diapherotrites archaeon]
MFKEKNGLHFANLCIDPHKSPKEKKVLFSHAHSDHIKLSKHSTFFATPETIDLVKERNTRQYTPEFREIPMEQKTKFDGFDLTLKPNGHVLGSCAAVLAQSDKDFVVTSDFRLQDSLLFKGAKPIPADTLVLETTFGSPEYVFPSQEEVANAMIDWVGKNARDKLVLLSGYALGKAQELVKIANEAGYTPLVHESIYKMNEIYKKHGIDIGNYELLDHNLKDFSVLIMPPQLVDRFLLATLREFDKRRIVSALATGWSYRKQFDITFPLSNHADYNDLISYVEQVNPKLVLTDHGFCEEFARKLSRLGFNARPLKQHKQRVLGEY